jgi:hypothetical protein
MIKLSKKEAELFGFRLYLLLCKVGIDMFKSVVGGKENCTTLISKEK